jgi:hypothetical protein
MKYAHGQVAGVSCDDNFVCHAFLLVGATLTTFDFPGAAGTSPGTLAYGINSAGQIVAGILTPMDQFMAFWRNPFGRENRNNFF